MQRPTFFAALGINEGLSFDCKNNYRLVLYNIYNGYMWLTLIHGIEKIDISSFRDVFWQGTCDNGCLALAEALGWKDELIQLREDGHKVLLEKYPLMNNQKCEVPLVSNQQVQQSQSTENELSPNSDKVKESSENE